ncbi:hypothetical protein NPX13_g8609 [Xylaria arbuscula]|uniref:Protein kinase domain-containing protein n=1 Tax=Xylaria arbuscula TaxID=114810 RepID=A0A9W8N830_9PEZI|nr:hypothetical protein NPX13_g8609 [Xylaria arbuscula]
MAEIVGIVASVLTLCQAISLGAKTICDLYEAPEEMCQLQNQIEIFKNVLRLMQTTASETSTDNLRSPLSNSEQILGELSRTVHEIVLSHNGHSSATRRIRWYRSRRNIVKQCQRLKESRESLWLGIGSDLLLSNHQIQLALDNSNRQSISAQSTVINKLQTIARLVGQRQNSEPIGTRESSPDSGELQVPTLLRTTARLFDEVAEDSISEGANPTEGNIRDQLVCIGHRLSHGGLSVASSLERSPRYCPEIYTDAPSSELISYNYYEVESTAFTRTANCAILYSPSPRQHRRLTISVVTTTDSSSYWRVRDGVPKLLGAHKTAIGLPNKLASSVLAYLRQLSEIEEDSHLDFFYRDQSGAQCAFRFSTSSTHFNAGAYIARATNFISHMNFSLFLRGVPGISPLVGVVVQETGTVSGFMTELPKKGHLFRHIGNGKPRESWVRLEKWCIQIIQAVAEVHSKGLVVGSLLDSPICAASVDGNDNAVLSLRFRTHLLNTSVSIKKHPPENRAAILQGADVRVLPPTDIFHLGQLLWRIINQDFAAFFPDGCIAGDTSRVIDNQTRSPTPRQVEGYPPYILDVIAACCAEDPFKRVPASQLLEMVPLSNLTSVGADSNSTDEYLMTPEECDEMHHFVVVCDLCGRMSPKHYFGCTTCCVGDFYLCPGCFTSRRHCLDNEHYLHEYIEGETDDKYYSSPNETGVRNVVKV